MKRHPAIRTLVLVDQQKHRDHQEKNLAGEALTSKIQEIFRPGGLGALGADDPFSDSIRFPRTSGAGPLAFSLVEMLVAIGIVVFLAALLVPGVGKALKSSRQASCVSNLRQVAAASQLYSSENEGKMPPQYDMGATFSVLLSPYAGGMKAPMIAPDIFYCPENVAQKTPPAAGYRITSKIYNKGWSGYFIGYLMNASIHTMIYLDESEIAAGMTEPSRRAVRRMEIEMPSKTVSLMDLLPWPQNDGPPSSALGRSYYFDPAQPEFSLGVPHHGFGNILFCDGHVEAFSGRQKLPVASLPSQRETWFQ